MLFSVNDLHFKSFSENSITSRSLSLLRLFLDVIRTLKCMDLILDQKRLDGTRGKSRESLACRRGGMQVKAHPGVETNKKAISFPAKINVPNFFPKKSFNPTCDTVRHLLIFLFNVRRYIIRQLNKILDSIFKVRKPKYHYITLWS